MGAVGQHVLVQGDVVAADRVEHVAGPLQTAHPIALVIVDHLGSPEAADELLVRRSATDGRPGAPAAEGPRSARILVSLGFRPATSTATCTSPSPGESGSGQSSLISITSGGPCRGTTAARIPRACFVFRSLADPP